MKKDHDKKARRYLDKLHGAPFRSKRLTIGGGHWIRRIDAYTLADAACISAAHAYRLIDNPDKMPEGMRQLVEMKLLGTVPTWPDGWHFYGGRLWSPEGIGFWPHCVENSGLRQQLQDHIEKDLVRLQEENKRLKALLSSPRELRVYHNDEPKPRRVLQVCSSEKRRTG